MAINFALASVGRNRMRYILSSTSTGTDTGTMNTIGGPSTLTAPDILTDLLNGFPGGGGPQVLPAAGNQGPLMLMAKVVAQGYGAFASGAQTQAKARALWLSDRSGADPGALIATATCRLTALNQPAAAGWFIDANVSGGNPVLNLQSINVGPSGTAYLDIFVGDTIGA